jgi:hypothetical protein
MKIDWKNLPERCEFPAVDWADPTHIPLMIAEVIGDCGNEINALSDEEYEVLQIVALDSMPLGYEVIRSAIQKRLYEIAEEGGWSDYLIEKETGRYPYEFDDWMAKDD